MTYERIKEAGDQLRSLIDDAYTTHIYDPQNDEMPDPKDCPYQQAIVEWDAAVKDVPITDTLVVVAKVFSDAEDAPTSFEPEQWIEGFQFARSAIACRIADELGLVDEARDQFLTACGIPEDPKPIDWAAPIEWSTGQPATFAPYNDAMPNHHVSACTEWYDVTGDTYVAVDEEGSILGCEGDDFYPTIRNVKEEADGASS